MPDLNGKVGERQIGWPRCRWCHLEIKPSTSEEFAEYENHGILPKAWYHVTTESEQCAARPNKAEPVPAIHEEPFMEAAWEFVARYRTLRRAFRDLSTSRASAIRRMHDYQELADKLIEAYDALDNDSSSELFQAVKAIREYRTSQIAAGWR